MMVFVKKQKGEPMAEYVNEDKSIIIKNETDSDFNVGVGIVFRKSGIYEISINDKTTTVTKVLERKTGQRLDEIEIAQEPCEDAVPLKGAIKSLREILNKAKAETPEDHMLVDVSVPVYIAEALAYSQPEQQHER